LRKETIKTAIEIIRREEIREKIEIIKIVIIIRMTA